MLRFDPAGSGADIWNRLQEEGELWQDPEASKPTGLCLTYHLTNWGQLYIHNNNYYKIINVLQYLESSLV